MQEEKENYILPKEQGLVKMFSNLLRHTTCHVILWFVFYHFSFYIHNYDNYIYGRKFLRVPII